MKDRAKSARSGGNVQTQRERYFEAVAYFRAVTSQIRADQWSEPGLGVWTIRDLVGHTSGALRTVHLNLTDPLPALGVFESAADYFLAATATPGLMAAVAERGREAGAALGTDPLQTIDELTKVVRPQLMDLPLDALVPTRFGTLPLDAYLDTKIFELIVHTLDICAATGITLDPPAEPLAAALRVTLQLAGRRTNTTEAASLLRALTGRTPLPEGYSMI